LGMKGLEGIPRNTIDLIVVSFQHRSNATKVE